jgi:YidC/Oxa1 family membrane protein insertase
MELYKEREISPFASFLPLLIQLPVLFAMFVVLKDITHATAIAKLAYEPIKHLPAIADIISGKTPFHPTFLGVVNLTKPSVFIAGIAAVAQFIQTKQITPKVTPGDQQAQMMTGMTYVFPALTFFIGLSLPAALSLYWATASLMAILQQYLVLKRDVRELEEGTPEPVNTKALPKKTSKGKARAKGGKA